MSENVKDIKLEENVEEVKAETVEAENKEATPVEPVSEIYVPEKPVKRHMGIKTKRRISNGVIYTILVLMSILWLLPYVFIILQSLEVGYTGNGGNIIPHDWGFGNYVKLFTETKFPRWFLNTFLMGLAVSVLQTIFVLSMSYTLSRLRFKGRKLLMNLMLVLGMFPGFLTMIVLYRLLNDMNMIMDNAIFGLILVYVASSGMGYYISKGFFDTIPRSLDEAARVDGATRLQVFYKIIMPLAKPIIIYTVLTAFMAPWGDFIFARYISNNTSDSYNVAVGLWTFLSTKDGMSNYYTVFCAGGVVVSIPITALFLWLQKYYVEGVTGGAVKG